MRAQYTYSQLCDYPAKRLWNQVSMVWQGSLGWVMRESPAKKVSQGRATKPSWAGGVLTAFQKEGKVLNAGIFLKGRGLGGGQTTDTTYTAHFKLQKCELPFACFCCSFCFRVSHALNRGRIGNKVKDKIEKGVLTANSGAVSSLNFLFKTDESSACYWRWQPLLTFDSTVSPGNWDRKMGPAYIYYYLHTVSIYTSRDFFCCCTMKLYTGQVFSFRKNSLCH